MENSLLYRICFPHWPPSFLGFTPFFPQNTSAFKIEHKEKASRAREAFL